MSIKSTARRVSRKLRGDAPPFRHASGRWAKKVNGRLAYLGSIADDPDGVRALRIWSEQKERIRAGYRPQIDTNIRGGVTVKELFDAALTAKEALVQSGEITRGHFNDLLGASVEAADILGRATLVVDLCPDDFARLRAKFAKGVGLITLRNHIRRVCLVFKWGYESGLLDAPARMGLAFKTPTAKTLRVARAAKPPRCFSQADLQTVIDAAGVPLKAMILLGINCGLGNSDCARLTFRHIKNGWLDFPRPKTGEPRRSPLWPETIKALEAAIAERPTPKDTELKQRVFVTKYGSAWTNTAIAHEVAKLLDSLGLRRPGHDFYALRHTLQTEGDGARDRTALSRIMGHVTPSNDISGHYRERIDDARLVAVSEYVRAWLFSKQARKRKAR